MFARETFRDETGCFVVSIPLIDDAKLGNSKEIVIKRFLSLERKFHKLPELKQMYAQFIQEYEEVGHMTKVNNFQSKEVGYFFPHHPVVREASATTKLRVVFDGSCSRARQIPVNP